MKLFDESNTYTTKAAAEARAAEARARARAAELDLINLAERAMKEVLL